VYAGVADTQGGVPSMNTSGEPEVAGPVTPWEQQFLPWESAGQLALSPTRVAGCIEAPILKDIFYLSSPVVTESSGQDF
jgi:hypothetical protein